MLLRRLRPLALCLLAALWSPSVHAQKQLHHQLILVNENDNYTFSYTDRYYSNGMMLRYTTGATVSGSEPKKLLSIEAGQQIFTPFTTSTEYRKFMDRPFTGFLYTRVQRTRINHQGQVLQWGLLAGVVGEKAFGREVQRWHHRTWGLKYPYGWEKQLKTGVGLGLEGRFVQPLVSVGNPQFGAKLDGSVQGSLGNLFVQAATAMLLRLGAVANNQQATAYDAAVGHTAPQKQPAEWYFFYEPQLMAQGHNATLQGGLWQKADSYYTTTPAPLVCRQKLGFVYAPRRWTAALAYCHRSKEAVTMHGRENWGTVALGYRW